MSASVPAVGDRVGDWILDRTLGEGGMGAVYAAHHALVPGVTAALKVMKQGGAPDDAARFFREIRAVLRLNHPNVVRVTGFGHDPRHDALWMAMELVEGGDLERRLRDGPLPLDELLRTFVGLAEALAHAHEHGVSHRDLKPSNVLLDADGRARLVDFGIAVQQHETRLTSTGLIVGTPAYLPPELFGSAEISPTLADLYAFGQVMVEAATGRPAFPEDPALGASQQLVRIVGMKIQSAPLDPGPAFPEDFRALARDLTAPDPAHRLPDARRLVEQLRRLHSGEPATVASPPPPGARPPDRRPPRLTRAAVRWTAAAVVGVLALGLTLVAGAAGAAAVAWVALRPASPAFEEPSTDPRRGATARPEVAPDPAPEPPTPAAPPSEPAPAPPDPPPRPKARPKAEVRAPAAPPPAAAPAGTDAVERAFRDALTGALGPIHACYADAVQDRPDLQGTLVVSMVLLPDGSTTEVRLVSSALAHAAVERCALDAMASIRLPPRPGGSPILVQHPIVLSRPG